MRHAVALSLAVVLAAGCGSSHRAVTLTVHAASPLADAPVEVDVHGLPSGGRATLRARWTAWDGIVWTSSTALRADGHGAVRLRGVDGTRFLWAMRPPRGTRDGAFASPVRGDDAVALSVLAGGRTVARAALSRRVTPGSVRVRRLRVKRDGVYGELFTPPGRRRHAGVLLFGGSEGGDSMIDAAGLLAAHGYTTLSLGYFAVPGRPKHLVDIPLEYFVRALRILRRQPHVDPDRVVTLGVSRGGEASLLLASKFPRLIHGAIGLVPSSQVNASPYRYDRAAWSYRGRPLAEGTPIAVERIDGPILAVGAAADGVWDSAVYVHQIELRLRDRRFRFPHTALTYPGAGHWVGHALPYTTGPPVDAAFGGTARADAAARADLWPRILRFLVRLSRPRG